MSEAVHARYRARLTALASDAQIVRVIARLGPRRGWSPSLDAWVRTYGRFNPDRDPFATLVFQVDGPPQTIVRIDAFDTRPTEESGHEACVPDPAAGWLRIARFPTDPALPMLPSLLAGPGHATVVRYCPHLRCTIRFHDGRHTVFAKVFPDDKGERIHAENLAVWRAACRGELGFRVAKPGRWDRRTRTLWQAAVIGVPAAPRLFGTDGLRLAHGIGRAAASLNRASLKPRKVFDATAQLARSIRTGKKLARRVPHLAGRVSALLEELSRIHAALGNRPLHPIHGDLHPEQWLDDGSRLGLVDFDQIALGEPELDAATFLGALEFEQTTVPIERLTETFLIGYESIAGPLDRRRLATYRAHKRLNKALRLTNTLRPDGDVRAEHILEQALSAGREALQ